LKGLREGFELESASGAVSSTSNLFPHLVQNNSLDNWLLPHSEQNIGLKLKFKYPYSGMKEEVACGEETGRKLIGILIP